MNGLEVTIGMLLALVWLGWRLLRARKARLNYRGTKQWKLLREVPGDWKDAVYNPRESRKPRK
jgi:hypothetical protein